MSSSVIIEILFIYNQDTIYFYNIIIGILFIYNRKFVIFIMSIVWNFAENYI